MFWHKASNSLLEKKEKNASNNKSNTNREPIFTFQAISLNEKSSSRFRIFYIPIYLNTAQLTVIYYIIGFVHIGYITPPLRKTLGLLYK
jgi:hypothetical protein